MARGDQEGRLRRDLRAINADGAAFGFMVGVGETYLPAFALAVGMGQVEAGLIGALPLLAGAVIQLVAPIGVGWVGSMRRWVVGCAVIQALSFVPLIAAGLAGRIPPWALYLIAALYWGSGMSTGTVWSTWVSQLVPLPLRAPFFARRSRATQAMLLLGLAGGGVTLHAVGHGGLELIAFATLFGAAMLSRLVSAAFLWSQSESPRPIDEHVMIRPSELLRRSRHSADGRLLVYLLMVQIAAQLAAPYFTPFMLEQLHFDYVTYMLLIATSFVAKALVLPLLGELATRTSARRLLWIGGVGIVPLSALWIASDSVPYLVAIQVLAGVAWAAHELATFLLFFETIRDEERTGMLTTFNLLNAVALVTGATLGGIVLTQFGEVRDAYFIVFGLSALGRAATLILLARVVADRVHAPPMGVRVVAARPAEGSIDAPLLPTIRNGADDAAPPTGRTPPRGGAPEAPN